MNSKLPFFDYAASVGLTKHVGSMEATEALIELCHIGEGQTILDVGCGVGVTPVYLARKYRCNVIGVDINEGMVKRSEKRAKRAGVSDRVEFKVADAQELPFDDDVFDAVITESVTVFPEDKQQAVDEYARVTKPGGYVGLNESVWLKAQPPPEITAWVFQDVGGNVQPLTADAWTQLLEGAGLKDIIARSSGYDTREEAKGLLRRYGLVEALCIVGRMLALYARNPSYRSFVQRVKARGVTPANLEEFLGYGLFVGRK